MIEEDESAGVATGSGPEDNSLGRLLTLSDGIFAIAMTLLALDLKVPDVDGHPSDAALRHLLAANADSYWSYLLTFYVVAGYWIRHRRLLRSVVVDHPLLTRDSLALLVFVAAMPFPASLLGSHGSDPISLALYGAVNAAATLALIVMSSDVRRLHLLDDQASDDGDYAHRWRSWLSVGVFLLCIPSGYVFGRHGPYVLLLLAIPDRFIFLAGVTTRLLRRVR